MELTQITTPSGHKVFVKPYLTYGQSRELQRMWLKNIRIDGNKREFKDFSADVQYEVQEVAVKMLVEKVVEADGTEHTGEAVLDVIMNWKAEDGKAAMDEIDRITSGDITSDESKKKAK